ncbi:hypothetical protein ILUMI_03502 [Ignelater luminosus]|uniref:Uncharacterized protein n=1 Tax=Ignelater luminosus TaxID=2038154 RepID=A0A8K0DG78_IGNLU|nr:hypothetical protein ILUMI_03502 [Ignelater luminosus]
MISFDDIIEVGGTKIHLAGVETNGMISHSGRSSTFVARRFSLGNVLLDPKNESQIFYIVVNKILAANTRIDVLRPVNLEDLKFRRFKVDRGNAATRGFAATQGYAATPPCLKTKGSMPRTRKKTTKKARWAENDLKAAMKQVSDEKSVKSIAVHFNIPRSTLRDKLKTSKASNPEMGRPAIFNKEQEKDLTTRDQEDGDANLPDQPDLETNAELPDQTNKSINKENTQSKTNPANEIAVYSVDGLPGVPCFSGSAQKLDPTQTKHQNKIFSEALKKFSPISKYAAAKIKENLRRKGHSSILTGTPLKAELEKTAVERQDKEFKKKQASLKAASKLLDKPTEKTLKK